MVRRKPDSLIGYRESEAGPPRSGAEAMAPGAAVSKRRVRTEETGLLPKEREDR